MNSNSRFEFLTKLKLSKWQLDRTFEILFEYYEFEFALGNSTLYGENIMEQEHECEV